MDLNPQEQAIFSALRQRQQPQSQIMPQKKKGNFFTDLIPTATSILGGIGGTILAPGIGTGAGGAAGGLIGTKLRNMLTGQEDNAGDYLSEGAFGALGGIGKGIRAIGGAGKALAGGEAKNALSILRNGSQTPTMLNRIGQGIEKTGGNLIGSQADVTRKAGREILGGTPMSEVFNNINKRTGLTNMDDMLRVAQNYTGGNGVMSELTRNAVGNSKGVNIGDLRRVTNDLLTNQGPLIGDNTRKNILNQVKESVGKAYGGDKGSLNPLANPLDAFDIAKNFEKQANFLKTKATLSPEAAQAATIYDQLGKTITDRLLPTNEVREGLSLAKPAASKTLSQLAVNATRPAEKKAYEKLGKELLGIDRTKNVRSAQSDFVKLSQLAGKSSEAEMGAGARLGGQLQGIGRLVQNPLNIAAVPLDAASPNIGGKLSSLGRKLQTTNSQGPISTGAKMLATQLPARFVGGEFSSPANAASPVGAASTAQMLPNGNTATDFTAQNQDSLSGLGGNASSILGALQSQGENSMYAKNNVVKDIQDDLQKTGGQNMDKYIKLYQFLNPEPKKGASPFGKPTAQQHGYGLSGSASLSHLTDLISQDPNVLNKAATPGQDIPIIGGFIQNAVGAGDYQSTAGSVLDALARARTGAVMSPSEKQFYLNTQLPRAGDNQATINNKLKQLQLAFQPFVNPDIGSQDTSLEDMLGGGSPDSLAQLLAAYQ